jgi:hypothetical protein
MGRTEEVIIDKLFSKGFLQDKGKNKTPDFYADVFINLRIKNGGITPRLGTTEVFNNDEPTLIRGINSNSIISGTKVYYVSGGHLRSIDTAVDPIVSTDIGDLMTTNLCRIINYGTYMIILTGADKPRHYDGTTLAQVSGSEITAWVNPEFGVKYAGFTFINSKLNRNLAYYSRPITLANQNYCYDWSGSGSGTIDLKDELLGMTANLNAIRCFTKSKIQRVDKSNVTTTGGVTSPYAIEFAQGYDLASHDSIVNAGQVIMFLTKNKKIGTINYKGTVTEPQMSIISDTPWMSIDGFMQSELVDDQSESFGFYDRNQNIANWFVKSKNSTVNDICLIYDIQNETFYIDDNKFYSCMTSLGDDIYAGSAFSHRIIQDENGNSDRGSKIYCYFETTDIVVGGWPANMKEFVGQKLAGQINSLAVINWTTYVDDALVFNKNIVWSNIASTTLDGIGSSPIWGQPVGGDLGTESGQLVDFEKRMGVEYLRKTGKKIKSVFSAEEIGQDFILDYYSVSYKPKKRSSRQDNSFN